jgi:hypothetical protein
MQHGAARQIRHLGWLALLLAVTLFACTKTGPPLAIGPDGLPEGQVGQPYSATITITQNQGPVERVWVEQGFLPAGLMVVHTPGATKAVISGVPEEAADTAVRIAASVSSPKQIGRQDYRVIVHDAPAPAAPPASTPPS